jgi:hypothetical protein
MKDRNSTSCLRCGSHRLVRGRFNSPRSTQAQFKADAARFGFFRSGLDVSANVSACVECGLVTSELYVQELNDHLSFWAKPEIKAWLHEKPDKPL